MQISTISQVYSFGIFLITGILIGFIFDIFRIVRKTFKSSDLVTYIEDMLFWIICGLILIYSIFIFNNGEIRAYIFIAIFLGIIIYILTISHFFVIIGYKFSNFVKNMLLNIFFILLKILKKVFFRPITFVSINISNISQKISSKLSKYTTKTPKKSKTKEGL